MGLELVKPSKSASSNTHFGIRISVVIYISGVRAANLEVFCFLGFFGGQVVPFVPIDYMYFLKGTL